MRRTEIAELIDKLGTSPTKKQTTSPTKKQTLRAVEKIRSKLIIDVAAAEAQARYPGSRVHKDVEIWVEQREMTSVEFKINHPDHQGVPMVLPTPKGDRVHILSTDIDLLVVQPQKNGKARIVHREEIKSGLKDKPAKAQRQLDKGLRRLKEAANKEINVRLIENGSDITDTIDLRSAYRSSGVIRGPAGKGFEENLGISARDLESLVKELVEIGGRTLAAEGTQ